MNFTINRDLFLSNLNDVSKAMSNKPQQPVAAGGLCGDGSESATHHDGLRNGGQFV